MSYDQPTPGQPEPWGTPASPYGQPNQPGQPVSGQPGYGQPVSGQPNQYDLTGSEPVPYEQPGYQQPVSGQPVSSYPGYGQQPGYGPPGGYPPPGYGPPGMPSPGLYPPRPDERQSAMLAHLLGLFLGWLGPLIIYLTKKDESRFVRHHAADALNLTLTSMIVALVSTLLGCVLSFIVIGILFFFLLFAYWILIVVFMIIACAAANRGEWYAYPAWLRIPMVK